MVRLTSIKPQGFSCPSLLTPRITNVCSFQFFSWLWDSNPDTPACAARALPLDPIFPVLILYFSVFEIFKSTEGLKYWYNENLFILTHQDMFLNFFFFLQKNTDFRFISSKIADSKMQLLRRLVFPHLQLHPSHMCIIQAHIHFLQLLQQCLNSCFASTKQESNQRLHNTFVWAF